MSAVTGHRSWTEAEFFRWLERQDGRHELVDGMPRAMTGATQRHDFITTSLIVALGNRLRGTGCRTGTSDTAIRIPGGNSRYPDAAVDCGRFDETARVATEPTLVAEVLSPSTAEFDQVEKLEEYRRVPMLRHILLINPDQPRILLRTRDANGQWDAASHAGLAAEVPFTALRIALPLAELYEGLTFRGLPRLVMPEDETG